MATKTDDKKLYKKTRAEYLELKQQFEILQESFGMALDKIAELERRPAKELKKIPELERKLAKALKKISELERKLAKALKKISELERKPVEALKKISELERKLSNPRCARSGT